MNSPRLRWIAPLVFLAVMFGGIGIAQATGQWVTSGKAPIVAGQLTADDLKGWMTLQQAADGLGMPVDDLISLVGAPAGVTLAGSTAFKDVEGVVPGFELSAFREAVRAKLAGAGAPTPSVAPTATPTPAPASHVPSPAGTGAASGVTGSMTLRQVAAANGLDPVTLATTAGLPATVDLDATLRSLRDGAPGFEIQAVRDAVEALR